MKRFKVSFIAILTFGVIIISAIWNLTKNWEDWTTPPCIYTDDANLPPREFTQNKNDLVFFTIEEKQKLISAIDTAENPKDLDSNLFFAYSEIFDNYNLGMPADEKIYAPEFLSDNPESISITSRGCKSDLLSGVGLSPIKKEDMDFLKSFAKLFVEETARYPLSWWERAVPPFVVFVKAVRVNGEIVGGVEQGAVIYNIMNVKNPSEARRVVHHELMHWLDHYYVTANDTAWPGVAAEYKNEYDLSTDENYTIHPAKGFVTGYAKTNIAEDRAEVYSYLFAPDANRLLKTWRKTDPALDAKVIYLKKYMKKRIFLMDEKYFDTL